MTGLIAMGGAVGAVARYWFSLLVYHFLGQNFPYGTLAVNATGSFLIGFLSILFIERFNGYANELRALLLVGLLGGFTTFSSFSLETLNLVEQGAYYRAIVNVLVTVTVCLLLTWLGIMLGRQL